MKFTESGEIMADFLCNFLQTFDVPLVMLIFAYFLLKRTPKINGDWGLRTKAIQASEAVWNNAHRLWGKFLLISGIVTGIAAIIISVHLGITGNVSHTPMHIQWAIQSALLAGSLIVTEQYARRFNRQTTT